MLIERNIFRVIKTQSMSRANDFWNSLPQVQLQQNL
jgi:hypothetical protein